MFAGFLIGFLVCLLLCIASFFYLTFCLFDIIAVLPHTSAYNEIKEIFEKKYIKMVKKNSPKLQAILDVINEKYN